MLEGTPLNDRIKATPSAARRPSLLERFLPAQRLTSADYVTGVALLLVCFILFFHGDIEYIGCNSLNFLFGNPLDFYENAHKYQGAVGAKLGAVYPPFVYAILALWLLPMKLLGFLKGPETFPVIFVYWLKILTTATYLYTGPPR